MDICIRADGGSAIGMGHVVRMLVLAKELIKNDKNNVFFACRVDNPISDKYSPGINMIKRNNFSVVMIDEKKLNEEIIKIKADCIITDSYDADERYFNILKESFNISGCLDDENIYSRYNVDFLINQNLYAKDLKYKVNKYTKMLLGSKFIILRDEFRNNTGIKKIREEISDVMITVGGSDCNNVTEVLIKQLEKEKYNLHVVIGSGFEEIETLKAYENKNSKVKLYFDANMKELMDKVDVCIAACGTTIYELATCGTPIIGIVIVDNQELLAKFMNENKISKIADIENVCKELKSFDYNERVVANSRLKKLVDGNGVYRIVSEIQKMMYP